MKLNMWIEVAFPCLVRSNVYCHSNSGYNTHEHFIDMLRKDRKETSLSLINGPPIARYPMIIETVNDFGTMTTYSLNIFGKVPVYTILFRILDYYKIICLNPLPDKLARRLISSTKLSRSTSRTDENHNDGKSQHRPNTLCLYSPDTRPQWL